ncbi:prenyltransferase/squalene oxidase repeat-containing protein [Streptomyces acidiscabies]|uniref:prenyltransferase/squalene oxidase repeat-containing protein n=1 Tax=Streptomyces acidiscabies TaxID=42234 RepID=UPI000950F6FB|nr:prenyltransferase/squalene oxidase repeat-containing protein [Streptomyces acidiscabies]
MITAGIPAAVSPLPATTRQRRCRDRLALRVGNLFGADGLLPAPVESRVLESALLLALVADLLPGHPAHDRLARYLKHTLDTAPPDPLQTAVARAALDDGVTAAHAADAELDRFAHFTAGRKRLMFHTLLAALGAAPYPRIPWEAYAAPGEQSWLVRQMTALKAIAAHGRKRPDQVGDTEWATLEETVHGGRIWEGNHLARLLALLALRHHPTRRAAAVRGTEDTLRHLRPDGGLPFITGMDVFTTALAGLALIAAGQARHPALPGAADALAALQHDDGGFGFTRGVRQSDTDDTAYCLEFLRATAPTRHARTVRRAEDFLLAQRNDDGGFPTFAHGVASERAMTAAAVNALAPSPRCRHAVTGALHHLAHPDRLTLPPESSWSRNTTNAAFRTVLACRAADPGTGAGADALRRSTLGHLTAGQRADGGFGHREADPSDPISTAYAAIALAHLPNRSAALGRAVDFLVARQRPDGGFTSVPDQAGPRPLLYDTPALADVCVLLGLGHALER